MAEHSSRTDQALEASQNNCNVNMTMNFIIGAVAVAVAVLLAVWLLGS